MNLKWVLDRDKGTVAPPAEYLEFVKKKRREFIWLNSTTALGAVVFAISLAYLQKGAVTRGIAEDIFLWNVVGMLVGGLASYLA